MKTAEELQKDWATNPRWKGITRTYSPEEVINLRGSIDIKHSIAEHGAKKLWDYMQKEDYVNALGALTGNQAMQQVKAGLKAIYLSGWQVAADAIPHAAWYSQTLHVCALRHLRVHRTTSHHHNAHHSGRHCRGTRRAIWYAVATHHNAPYYRLARRQYIPLTGTHR